MQKKKLLRGVASEHVAPPACLRENHNKEVGQMVLWLDFQRAGKPALWIPSVPSRGRVVYEARTLCQALIRMVT